MTALWLRHRSVRENGRRGREWVIHEGDGGIRYTAFARRVPGPIDLFEAADATREVARARPRRGFVFTGRYTVAGPDGERLGFATRGGRFSTADGRRLGRFRDARSLKRHIGESLAVAVAEGLLGGDGSGDGPGADGFVLELDGLPPGRLTRERLPFMPPDDEPRREGAARQLLRKALPQRAGSALLDRHPPRAWRLEVPDLGAIEPRLLLASALLVLEVALW